jgi:hypothetical protein
VAVPIVIDQTSNPKSTTETRSHGDGHPGISKQFGVRDRSLDFLRVSVAGVAGVPFSAPTFVPVDEAADFVIICGYTGKEVVE